MINNQNEKEEKKEDLDEINVEQELEEKVKKEKEENNCQEKIRELEQQVKRYLADYQNLQRRTQEQKAEWIKVSNRDLLLKLLPVLDTLILAAKHINDKGFDISIQQFFKLMEQEGVTRIKTVGEEFNPQTMEAITTKEGENGKVLEEIRAGFMLYDTILRSAQVIVGKESN